MYCSSHPQIFASKRCSKCSKWCCHLCTKIVNGKTFCPDCAGVGFYFSLPDDSPVSLKREAIPSMKFHLSASLAGQGMTLPWHSPAKVKKKNTCAYHPERENAKMCSKCNKMFCYECLRVDDISESICYICWYKMPVSEEDLEGLDNLESIYKNKIKSRRSIPKEILELIDEEDLPEELKKKKFTEKNIKDVKNKKGLEYEYDFDKKEKNNETSPDETDSGEEKKTEDNNRWFLDIKPEKEEIIVKHNQKNKDLIKIEIYEEEEQRERQEAGIKELFLNLKPDTEEKPGKEKQRELFPDQSNEKEKFPPGKDGPVNLSHAPSVANNKFDNINKNFEDFLKDIEKSPDEYINEIYSSRMETLSKDDKNKIISMGEFSDTKHENDKILRELKSKLEDENTVIEEKINLLDKLFSLKWSGLNDYIGPMLTLPVHKDIKLKIIEIFELKNEETSLEYLLTGIKQEKEAEIRKIIAQAYSRIKYKKK